MDFLNQNAIQTYSTHSSDLKAVLIERFNRLSLYIIKEPSYIEEKACWLNRLDAAFEKYKHCVHRATRMTPFEANNKLIPNVIPSNTKLQMVDFVRFPDKRNISSKDYTTNCNRELFKINKITNTNPVTYDLEDKDGELIERKNYEQELLSVYNSESTNKTLESMSIFLQYG